MRLGRTPIIVLDPQGFQILNVTTELVYNRLIDGYSVYVKLPPEFELEEFKRWQAEVRSAPSLDHVMFNWHTEVA